MGAITGISWCDHTFNPWIGCTKVSPACDGCYAEAMMGDQGRYKRVTWGKPGQRATHSRTAPSNWRQPLKWDRDAAAAGARPFVFCASLADVFDNQADPEWRRDLFDLIRATPNLVWLLLTKRPQNIKRLFLECHLDPPDGGSGYAWPSNAAMGCTVVTQAEAERDVPQLLAAKGEFNPAFAFVSMEPLLGAVDLTKLYLGSPVGFVQDDTWALDALQGRTAPIIQLGPDEWELDGGGVRGPALDWVITGGETDQGGHKARPAHPGWLRSLRDQCASAGVAYHFKQWGEFRPTLPSDDPNGPYSMAWPDGHVGGGTAISRGGLGTSLSRVGKKAAGRELDGETHDARPGIAA